MPDRTDWLARSIVALAVLCGAGSLVLFATWLLGSHMHVQWLEAAILGWDALLSFAFFMHTAAWFADRSGTGWPVRWSPLVGQFGSGKVGLRSVRVVARRVVRCPRVRRRASSPGVARRAWRAVAPPNHL